MLLAGYSWGEFNFYLQEKSFFPSQLEGKNIVINGRIEGVPAYNEEYQKFQFYVEKPNWKGKISLFWYQHKKHFLLKPGQEWCLTVKLKKPHGYRNLGGFDYDAWLFEQNIRAKGYVVNGARNILLASSSQNNPINNWINQVRQNIGEKWESFSSEWPLLGVLLAFTVGLTSDITPEQWQVFTNTGTIHLISISGFHINLIAGMAYMLVNFFWRRIPLFCERFPAQRAAAIGAILAGIFYSLLAGNSIPTQRSLIMLTIFMGGLLLQRQTHLWSSFCWSIFIIVLLDPFAPLNLSFWLTYSAVAIILYALIDKPIKKSSFKSSLKLQIQIFLGLVPFSLFWFSQVSVSSLWANLVAIPVTGFLVLPLALSAIFLAFIYFPWAIWLMKISHWFLEELFLYLQWISQHYPFIFVWCLNKIWMLCLGVLGVLLLLAPKGWPGRWLGLLFWLPLFFPLKNIISYGEANFTLLDVGQGLASVIQTKNHILIFDTGPKMNENFDTGKAVVLPYLRNQHIQRIDALVISHKDLDHSGGLHSILKNIVVNKVWLNDPRVLKRGKLCKPNISWKWDGVTFKFLTRGLDKFNNTNDTSCVLKISNEHHSILLPGDLEARSEKVLAYEYGNALKTDLLVAAHHGSKTSSSLKWLSMTKPKYVLFATGYLNRYHFPNPSIVTRYEQIDAQHWSTADCGMIQWKLLTEEETLPPSCYVQVNSHPWYTL